MDLKKLRLESGLTQKQVAFEIGHTTAQYISNVERGICPLAPRHFVIIARLYDITPNSLVAAHMKQTKETVINKAEL